jgi:hypothetical protein
LTTKRIKKICHIESSRDTNLIPTALDLTTKCIEKVCHVERSRDATLISTPLDLTTKHIEKVCHIESSRDATLISTPLDLTTKHIEKVCHLKRSRDATLISTALDLTTKLIKNFVTSSAVETQINRLFHHFLDCICDELSSYTRLNFATYQNYHRLGPAFLLCSIFLFFSHTQWLV